MENLYKLFRKTFTARRTIIILVISSVFFIKIQWVVALIEKYLMVPKDFSNSILDTVFIIFTICFSFWFIYIFLRKNYKASFIQILGSIVVVFLLAYFLNKSDYNHWKYHSLFDSDFEYIWLIIIPLLVFIFFHFRSLIYPFKNNDDHFSLGHRLIHDNPKVKDEEDLLGYSVVVEELFKTLTSQKSEKSITVGLVGPWGNGKSSIIQMLIDKISPEKPIKNIFKSIFKRNYLDEYLFIHFLPYLNHQEEDLISEFFRQLSTKLKPYNGKLSNLVLEYSKRLVDVYKNNINVNFFDKHISSFDKTSAKEMYDDINNRLKETNKKVIVFVDDLDRLNSKEILQVLKLIRNSADFTNVIFLVAMDKAYVVKLLTKKQEVLDARFIDKFFQLEVYLPEIKKAKLREVFKELLIENAYRFGANYERDVDKAIGEKGNLFNDYIENIRDVKRTVNQILYEYKQVEGAIDLKDFMNFTYFKLKFPTMISYLRNNRIRLLKSDRSGKNYNLRKLTPTETGADFDFFAHITDKSYKYELLQNYEVFSDFFDDNDKTAAYDSVVQGKENKLLVLKTLSFLFGDDNSIQNVNSIMNITNFMMLMEQRVYEDYLEEIEFENLFRTDLNEIGDQLDNLNANNKIEQVLDRLSYFSFELSEKLTIALNILGLLYEKNQDYKIYEQTIQSVIGSIIYDAEKIINEKLERKEEFKNAIIKGLLNSTNLSSKTKIMVTTDLWLSQDLTKELSFTEAEISEILLDNYEDFLRENDNVDWDVNDSRFFVVYNQLISIPNIKNDIHVKLKAYLERNSIKLFCAQSLNFSTSSLKALQLSDIVVEIFGSFMNFKNFVENHGESSDPEIIEYIKFLDISMYTNFKAFLIFEFEVFELMKKRVISQKDNKRFLKNDQFENLHQILFLFDDIALKEKITSNINLFHEIGLIYVTCFDDSNWFSLFATIPELSDTDLARKAADVINSLVGSDSIEINDEDLNSGEPFFNEGFTVRLFSIQPKP